MMPVVTLSIPPTLSTSIFISLALKKIKMTIFHSQCETSEIFLGEWMEKRGIRHEIVLATKVIIHLSPAYMSKLTNLFSIPQT